MTDLSTRDSVLANPRPSFGCADTAAQGSLLEPHPRGSGLTSAMTANHDAAPIACQIIGSDRCEVGGLVVKHNAPVLAICRALIEAGYDPEQPLEAYRGDTLCLRVSSIGHGAQYTVEENRSGGPPVLRRYKAFPGRAVAPPMRPTDSPSTHLARAM
jgi:hypothetical protein